MAKQTNNTSGGIGFLGLLTIALIVLKLTNHINWPWGWVLAPLWLPAVIFIGFIGIGIIIAVIIGLTKKHGKN